MTAPLLFLSHRQSDTARAAGELWRELQRRLVDEVFLDVDTLEPGAPWSEKIEDALERATVLFVLIGKSWQSASDPTTGAQRLAEPGDWVRREIARALERGIEVVPVLLDGADPDLAAITARIEGIGGLAAKQHTKLRLATSADFAESVDALVAWLVKHGFREREDAAAAAGPADRYRTALRAAHQNLVPFFPEAGEKLLDEVYVEVTLGAAEGDPQALIGRSTLPALLRRGGRWVILGEPGAGKSTAARHLVHDLAGDNAQPLPVYVGLPEWLRSKRDLIAFVAEEHALPGLEKPLRAAASQGTVWFLFDGLDEVAGEQLATAQERVRAVAAEFKHCPVAVFSRPIGYRSWGPPFSDAKLESLSREAQETLLTHWLGDDAPRVWSSLRQLERLRDLAKNPLLLTLIASVARGGAALPTHRGQLYGKAIDLLLSRGARPQGEGAGVKPAEEARRLLAALALELQEHEANAWTKTELADALREVLEKNRALRAALKDNWPNVGAFLTEVAHHGAVLGPHNAGKDTWVFLHRQFREFMAAEALLAGEDGAWLARVEKLEKRDTPRWSETFGFACLAHEDPLAALEQLRDKVPAAALKATVEVETLAPQDALAFLLATEGCDGEDLLALVATWHDRGLDQTEVANVLWAQLRPRPTEELEWLYAALIACGEVDAERFFDACARPRPAHDDTEYVDVQAGTFLMGSPRDEAERLDWEGPQHEVTIAAFRLGKTAVTNAEYGRFADDFEPQKWKGARLKALRRHPAVNVSWWAAQLYAAWLGARLPTEAEWEYACRAGTKTPFAFGDNVTPDEVNYDGNHPYANGKKGRYREQTVEIGSLPANPWGLHEMHGNVWEWCIDGWHEDYRGAPDDGSAWETEGSVLRVVRGGSCRSNARGCRSAARRWWHAGGRNGCVGFRLARSHA